MNAPKPYRINSIDLLRGVVMILMALDHTRYYFHADVYYFNPLNLEKTTPILFLTRWITHFCAPVFVLLAGVSARLSGRKKTKEQLALFLVKRGIWLIFLELTVVNFSWFFNIHFPYFQLGAIWNLGISMICLAVLIFLPEIWIFGIGMVLIITNFEVDQVQNLAKPTVGAITVLIEDMKMLSNGGVFAFFHANQLTPYIGVMAIGYNLGKLFSNEVDAKKRKKILRALGLVTCSLFLLFRIMSGQATQIPKTSLGETTARILHFIDFSKYPPSMDYILATVGFALLFLAFTENISNRFTRKVEVFGRVPLFYYILHIYLIHLLAMAAVVACGHPWTDMIIRNIWISESPNLKGYGYNLGIVYLIWILVVVALYPLCKMYDRYKSAHKDKWWLSYL